MLLPVSGSMSDGTKGEKSMNENPGGDFQCVAASHRSLK